MLPRRSRLQQPTEVVLGEKDENAPGPAASPGQKRKEPVPNTQSTPLKPPAPKRSAAVVHTTSCEDAPVNGAAVADEWLEISRVEGLTVDDLLAAKVTGKKFDHKDKLAQAMPLLKKTRACVRWLRAELERAGEASRATVTRLEGEVVVLQARVAALQATADQAQADAEARQEALDAARGRLGEAEERERAAQKAADEARARQSELEVSLRERAAEALAAREEAAAEREEARQARGVADRAQELARSVQEHARRVEEQEAGARARAAAAVEEAAEARSRAAVAGEEAAAMRVRAEEAEKRRAAAEGDLGSLRQRAEAAEERLGAAREAHASQRASLEEQLHQSQCQAADLRGAAAEARAAAERAGDEARRLREELGAAQRAADEARAEREVVRETARRDREALSAAAAEAQERAASLEASLQRARGEAQTQMRELHEATTERERLAGELAAATEELQRWQGMYRSLEEELAELRRKRQELQSTSGDQAQLIASLRREVEVLTAQSRMSREAAVRSEEGTATLQSRCRDLEQQTHTLRKSLQEAETHRRRLHNVIQDLRGNIRVFCRVRPLHAEGAGDGAGDSEECAVDYYEDMERRDTALELKYTRNDREQRHEFCFDRVFRPGASQEAVFEEMSQLVQSALDGYRVCVFAYGQTGSGKTHTMMGTPEDPGTIPRAMAQVFRQSESLRLQGWEYRMRVSMLEIYMEEYRDLLGDPHGRKGERIEVQHDEFDKDTTLTNCAVVEVASEGEVQALVERAMAQRSVAATAMNERSSRSHSVFVLWIEGRNDELGVRFKSSLNMVDLAGSERLKDSLAEGERRGEAVSINASLSAVKTCFQQMVARAQNGRAHVNYRSSKLTWLLKPALEGEAKTLMFVNVSPAVRSAQETKCSMEFAAKVNSTTVGRPTSSKAAIAAAPSPAKRPSSKGPGAGPKGTPVRPKTAKV